MSATVKAFHEMNDEIDRLRTSNAQLLGAAKEILSAIASRDIGSFAWFSPTAEALKAAIEAAEEPAP